MSWAHTAEDLLNQSDHTDNAGDQSHDRDQFDMLNSSEFGQGTSSPKYGDGSLEELDTSMGEISQSYFQIRHSSSSNESPKRMETSFGAGSPPYRYYLTYFLCAGFIFLLSSRACYSDQLLVRMARNSISMLENPVGTKSLVHMIQSARSVATPRDTNRTLAPPSAERSSGLPSRSCARILRSTRARWRTGVCLTRRWA